ncbi:MAG: AAA family ATPase [Isosphaerales bacterium]
MKLNHVHIENFKGLRHLDLSLVTDVGTSPRRVTCLIGDNSSGKTTALQAIALTLSLATRRTRHPTEFRWHGFLPERVGSLGRTFVELAIGLDPEEVRITHELYQEWYDSQASNWKQTHRVVEPADHSEVRLVDEGRLYDLAEMSSGEQTIFSLLCDFIRLNITRSIVLIDELELHLHAAVQQALYAGLPRLGPDCQFLITTHSAFLTDIIPSEQEVRLEGERRCL